jgi:hypothetical protein
MGYIIDRRPGANRAANIPTNFVIDEADLTKLGCAKHADHFFIDLVERSSHIRGIVRLLGMTCAPLVSPSPGTPTTRRRLECRFDDAADAGLVTGGQNFGWADAICSFVIITPAGVSGSTVRITVQPLSVPVAVHLYEANSLLA